MTEADRVTAQAKADILPTGASSPILLSPTGHQEPGPREEGKKKDAGKYYMQLDSISSFFCTGFSQNIFPQLFGQLIML